MSRSAIFIGYHDADFAMKERLLKHLNVLKSHYGCRLWDASQVAPGQDWTREVQAAISAASVAILLVSVDLLNSRPFLEDQLPTVLKRRDENSLRIIPVIVRPCDFRAVSWLAPLQVMPRGAEIVTDVEKDFADVAVEVREFLDNKQARFRSFFGESIMSATPLLVFSHRRCGDDTIFSYPQVEKFPEEHRLGEAFPPSKMQVSPKDVGAWLAHEDIRAAGYLSRLFGEWTSSFVQLRVDGELQNERWREQPTVAVGLGFTAHTHRLLRETTLGGHVAVTWSHTTEISQSGAKAITDGFTFPGADPRQEETDDYALVARLVPRGSEYVHFICAGRTAPGTAVAGHFLASRWEDLLEEYKKDEEALPSTHHLAALIKHPRPELHSNPSDDIDHRGKIVHPTFFIER